MPLPWKKSKSGRISKFVTDLQQSPKHGGSLVVETGFPTSLIHLFFKNRDRLKKTSSKRNKAPTQTGPNHSLPTRKPIPVAPLPPPPLPPSVSEDPAASKIEESVVGDGGLTPENKNNDGGNGGDHGGGGGGGGCCVLMVGVVKLFVVAVLALSTKKLAVGITISAFALLFLEFAVPRVLTLLNLCPNAQVRLDSFIRKLIGNKKLEPSPSPTQERSTTTNNVSFEITESFEEPRFCIEETRVPEPPPEKPPVAEEREVLTIRDVTFTKEKSKSAKLKSKIVKKIVPKKLRSYKKKKKLKKMKEKEGVEIEIFEEGEGDSTTEASSLYSEDVTESEVSERYEIGSNPPLLESCEEIEEEEEEGSGSKGDLTKAMVMIVIALAGLVGGKVVAIVLTVSSCLVLRLVCSKSQTSL